MFVFVSETSGIETHREREKERERIYYKICPTTVFPLIITFAIKGISFPRVHKHQNAILLTKKKNFNSISFVEPKKLFLDI